MKILLIEDDEKLKEYISEYLKVYGYRVDEIDNFDNVMEVIKEINPNLIILDINLPKFDGFYFLKLIRNNYKTPVIILSARSDEGEQIRGMELGADDYVTKPFSPKILIAKIKALLKRTVSDEDDFNPSQNYNGLTINKLAHEVKINNEPLTLSPKEFELLVYLSDNMGIALSRDVILDNVWGIDYYGDLRTVDTNIKRLREKLGEKSNYIVTVRGSGYKFEVQNEK